MTAINVKDVVLVKEETIQVVEDLISIIDEEVKEEVIQDQRWLKKSQVKRKYKNK